MQQKYGKFSDYYSRYKEIELIGRGNYGSATLIQDLSDNAIYVAKKIILNNLKEKEQQSSFQEVKILKELRHPHIVTYKDSFIEDGVLIIVMEYCEEGDLAFHIKRKRQKNEYFSEKLILNWFLQIALALNMVHERRILHRDIKTSNIFLNSNGIVKLGDFGISKILENTNDAAGTVLGTPYYMSPEVCENKPYSYKSDVWALGCCLYELCTLKHAFDANNLLGLVYKIVKDKQDPLPNQYSLNMNKLVQKLLNKNERERPLVSDLFKDPFIEKTMREFIDNKGQDLTVEKFPIKKTLTHQEYKKILEEDKNIQEPSQFSNETPYQKMMRRKSEKMKEKEEELKEAARQAYYGKMEHKQRKMEDLFGNSPTIKPNSPQLNQSGSKSQFGKGGIVVNIPNKAENSNFFQTCQSLEYNETNIKPMPVKVKKYDSPLLENNSNNFQTIKSEFSYDEKPIKPLQNNDITENYEDDFEEYWSEDEDHDKTRLTIKASEREIDDVVNVYKSQLIENQNNIKKKNELEEIKEATFESSFPNNKSNDRESKIFALKDKYSNILGNDTFKKVYLFLKKHRQLETPDDQIRKSLLEMVGKNNLNNCFGIDQILFLENLN